MIIKVPFKNSEGAWHQGITDGTEKAPDAIVEILKKDVWLSESEKDIESFFKEEKEIKKDIYEEAKKILEREENVIFIGGDHSCSYYLAKAFSEIYKNPCFVIFDAHPDVMQHENLNHEGWLSFFLTKTKIDARNIFLLCKRASCQEEEDFIKKSKINVYSCKEIFGNIEKTCDEIMEQARKFDALYISIDIDAVDPSAAPGTGYIEPAGLSARELLYFIQRLRLLKNFRAADVVEINPKKDINNMTLKLGARIVAELL